MMLVALHTAKKALLASQPSISEHGCQRLALVKLAWAMKTVGVFVCMKHMHMLSENNSSVQQQFMLVDLGSCYLLEVVVVPAWECVLPPCITWHQYHIRNLVQ